MFVLNVDVKVLSGMRNVAGAFCFCCLFVVGVDVGVDVNVA